jgi:hypothetical protein
MTKDEIIEMWKNSGDLEIIGMPYRKIERFAKLVADKEREKSLELWMLLDDVDTADDIAKADDAIYRSLCRQAHKKRWDVLSGDDVDKAIRARGES